MTWEASNKSQVEILQDELDADEAVITHISGEPGNATPDEIAGEIRGMREDAKDQ